VHSPQYAKNRVELYSLRPPCRAQANEVADELSSRESALRKLPLPYSLGRLRDAGVAPEVVSEYVGVDEAALDGVYRIAEVKLSAAEAGNTCQQPC
jgi:hypothetical protein